MAPNRDYAIDKLHRDHQYLLELAARIKQLCSERDGRHSCRGCAPVRHAVCQENVGQLIRRLVELTLKHNLLEAVYMSELVPAAHRRAHQQAHLDIAEAMQGIRLVFAADGNALLAIEGIDRALDMLLAHFDEFDRPLEAYLQAA